MSEGQIRITVSGPSGSGKLAIIEEITNHFCHRGITWTIDHTTTSAPLRGHVVHDKIMDGMIQRGLKVVVAEEQTPENKEPK